MACFGSPIRTSVTRPAKARSMTSHWTGSVSWNSSTITIDQRRLIRSRAGASSASSAIGQPGEQVVEAEDAEQPLAPLQLPEDVVGEGAADAGLGLRGRVDRCEPGARVAHHLAGELERLGAGELGSALHVAEALEVEVVHDLGHELVEVLDEGHARVRVARDAERAEHELAELVGRGDRRRVEPGERVAQSGGARPLSSSDPRDRWVSSASSARPGSSIASAARTSWSRTRSRSSWLAARLKVMSSMSSSSALPSAT